MGYTDITPREAYQKMGEEGYVYLDVRTVEEFAAGHAKGAIHIPLFVNTEAGREFNVDFIAQVKEKFSPEAKLVIGCQAGGRSAKACQLLAQEGYPNLFNIDGGFGGRINPITRRVSQKGWQEEGLPCE